MHVVSCVTAHDGFTSKGRSPKYRDKRPQASSTQVIVDAGVKNMLRDDSVSLREGDTYHGRYRILRCIEADSTGAAYEAVDVTTNARQILRVVSAGTTKGDVISLEDPDRIVEWLVIGSRYQSG